MARPIPPRPTLATQTVMTPKEVLGVLRRHVLLIVILTLLGTAVGTGSWFLFHRYAPEYTAVGAVQVLDPVLTKPTEIGDTQTNRDAYDRFRNSKVMRIKSLGMLQELLRKDKVRNTRWFSQFVRNGHTDTAKAVEKLEKKLRVEAPRDDVHITISMTCGSPQESREIVNEMISLFLDQQKAEATGDMSSQLTARIAQAEKLRRELAVANDELRKIREGTHFGNLGETTFRDYLTESLADQETALSRLESSIVRLESQVEILKKRTEGDYDEVIREQVEQDPICQRMRDSIAMLEPMLAELETRFGESHRRVRETLDALAQRRQDLARRQVEIADILRHANYRNANDQLVYFTAELEAQRRQLQQAKLEYKEMSKVRADYLEAITRRDEKQAMLEEYNSVVEELRTLLDDPQVSKVKLAWFATDPLDVSFPRRVLFLPGGFVLGMLAGLALAFAIELLNDFVRTPNDVLRHVRAPLLGTICHHEEDDAVDAANLAHVVSQAPYSIMSECYRQLRTNLKLSAKDDKRKVLLITSGAGKDGKTSTAVNLAETLAAEHNRVLLIDANFRRPMVATLFPKTGLDAEGAGDYGLSNYLMGQCDADAGLIRSVGDNLDVIDCGPLPANPAELLAGVRMKDLLDSCRRTYDYIIIDGPPLLVSDAKNLAASVDGTVLVLNAETTRRGAAQRALRELREINAPLVGTVLVGAKAIKGGYFHEVFRSYQEYQRVQVGRSTA
jgi:succinoglycan biosynthesis transport protein ExoP